MFKTDLWDYTGQREHVWGLNIGAILVCSVGFFHMVEQNSVKINQQFHQNMLLPVNHNGI